MERKTGSYMVPDIIASKETDTVGDQSCYLHGWYQTLLILTKLTLLHSRKDTVPKVEAVSNETDTAGDQNRYLHGTIKILLFSTELTLSEDKKGTLMAQLRHCCFQWN